jgi:hypothetical protein
MTECASPSCEYPTQPETFVCQCECGRVMRQDGSRNRGHMVCGCGRRVNVQIPNRLVFEPGMCSWMNAKGGCTRPSIDARVPLCETHLRATVAYAADNRLKLGKTATERRELAELKADVDATPGRQQKDRKGSLQVAARAQRKRIEWLVACAGTVVYYVRLDGNRIKIGYTSDLPTRMRAFRVKRESVLAIEPGGQKVETSRHRRFANLALNEPGAREEYTCDAELLGWIGKMRSQHGDPFPAWRALRIAAIRDLRESGPLLFSPNAGIYDDLEAAELAGGAR